MGKVFCVCLGDSITYGWPFGPEASWVHIAAAETGLSLVNSGVSGDTFADMAKRFAVDVAAHEPELVIVTGGANDVVARESLAAVRLDLETIVKQALSAGITPVMGLTVPMLDRYYEAVLGELRQMIRQVAAENGLKTIDFCRAFIDPASGRPREELYLDDAHPNRRGYRALAEVAAEFLRKWEKPADRPVPI
jgi:acyl-CoA thioesterase-1